MTQQEEFEKAKTMIGSWIYDKTEKYVYQYVCDCYESPRNDGDVLLKCIAFHKGGTIFPPYITDENVWVSELEEYYCKLPNEKGVELWEEIKKYYDRKFKVVK